MESKDKKFLAVFLGVLIILCVVLAVFTFNFAEDHQMKWKSENIGGYTFNIPESLAFQSENKIPNSHGKIFSDDHVNLGINVDKNQNFSKKSLLDMYNVTNYTNVKFGNLEGYKSEQYTFAEYYFKVNDDVIQINFGGAKNTDILVEKILKNITSS